MKYFILLSLIFTFSACEDILSSEDTSSSSEETSSSSEYDGIDTIEVSQLGESSSTELMSSPSQGNTTVINIENSENVTFNNTTQTFDDNINSNNTYDSYNRAYSTSNTTNTDNRVTNNQQYITTFNINFDVELSGNFYHETDSDYGQSALIWGIDKSTSNPSLAMQYVLDPNIDMPWVKVVYDTEGRVDFSRYNYLQFKIKGITDDFRITFDKSSIAGYQVAVNSNEWQTITIDLNTELVNIFPDYTYPLENYWNQISDDISLINFTIRGEHERGVVWIDDIIFLE